MENEQIPEVEQEIIETTEPETQGEVAENDQHEETTENETAQEDARKEEARKRFEERESRRAKEKRLEEENERLRRIALHGVQHQQPQQRQQYSDPNEPKLDAYFDAGRTAEEWSRDHRLYLDRKLTQEREIINSRKSIDDKIAEYAKVNKDIHRYEAALAEIATPQLAAAIVSSENMGQLIEILALDEDKVFELNTIKDPYKLTRKLIELEAGLKKKPSVSGAPRSPSHTKPSKPIGGGVDISTMSKAEYRAYRNAQRK